MYRNRILKIALSVMFLVISVLSGIVPGEAGSTLRMFALPFFFSALCGFFCTEIPGALCGALSALFIFLIRGGGRFFTDCLPEMILYSVTGMAASLLYRKTGTILGSAPVSVLAGILSFGLSKVLFTLFAGGFYTLSDFVTEMILSIWPGLLLLGLLLPLLLYILKQLGILHLVRDIPRDDIVRN